MKTDMQLQKDVIAELEWDPSINAADVGVEVKEGVVTLTGHLDSYPEKIAAERAAQRVAGVRGVAVEIDVTLPDFAKRTDADIALAASDALRWNGVVPDNRVKVTVESGEVTLSGDLDWEFQRAAAEAAVRPLIGVRSVSNNIQLRAQMGPDNIKGQIEAALQRAAHLDADTISVSFDRGEVTLNGTVHSHTERQVVENAVWAAPGVTAVVDQLTIVD
jgi:osmotically-inducible protein OsmY